MEYQIIKVLHLTSLITWMGTMLLAPAVILMANRMPSLLRKKLVAEYRVVLSLLTTPAMIFTWIFGTLLMVYGSWFLSVWMAIKIIFVLMFSAGHGLFLGQLRKIENSIEPFNIELPMKIVFCLELLMLLTIISLVLLKPF